MTGDEQPMYKLCFALIFLLAREVAAPAVSVLPPMTIFENDQVRVIRTLEKPHVKGKFHEHQMNRDMIYLQLGKQRFEYQDGRKPVISEYEAGQVSWSAAEGMHSPECLTDEPFNIVEVELKRPGTGKKIASSLDPLKIDAHGAEQHFVRSCAQGETERAVAVVGIEPVVAGLQHKGGSDAQGFVARARNLEEDLLLALEQYLAVVHAPRGEHDAISINQLLTRQALIGLDRFR